jgi:hypothetical protein
VKTEAQLFWCPSTPLLSHGIIPDALVGQV